MPKIMKSMNVISRCQSTYRSEQLTGDLCGCHHSFVFAICNHPNSTQEELAGILGLNKSTVARTLCRLEELGYVTRTANPNDKRAFLIAPTERMLAALPAVRDIAAKWNRLLTADIPETDLAVFCSVLSKMEKTARALVDTEGEHKCGS